jgi:hypothetical protein
MLAVERPQLKGASLALVCTGQARGGGKARICPTGVHVQPGLQRGRDDVSD